MTELIKNLAYKILNLITFGKGIKVSVNGFVFKMPVRYYRYYHDGYEKGNFDFFKEAIKKDSLVIDIGGHIGLNAVVFAKIANKGKVYVFEPAPNSYKVVADTIRINSLNDRVFLFKEAVSKEKGVIHFYMNDTALADNANSIVQHRLDKKLKKIEVPVTSIDEFIADQKIKSIDFIKIDAEGVELDVLKGAVKCLENFKPKMTLGLHPAPIKQKGDSLAEIYDLLKKYNYKIELDGNNLEREEFCSISILFDVQLS